MSALKALRRHCSYHTLAHVIINQCRWWVLTAHAGSFDVLLSDTDAADDRPTTHTNSVLKNKFILGIEDTWSSETIGEGTP